MPSFTRGQWQISAGGSLNSSLWVSDGSVANAQLQDGTVVTAGHHLGDQTGGVGGHGDDPDYGCFITWVTSAWDTTRNQMMVSCGSGDQGWTTNEVNVYDLTAGAWSRPMDPPTRLWRRNGGTWTAGTVLGRNTPGDASPAAFIDTTGLYHAHAVPDAQNGQYLYPNGRQHYGGMIYMPTVDKYLLWAGVGWYSINGGAYLPFEWDPASSKWEGLTLDIPGNTVASALFGVGQPLMCWDSANSRVIVFCGSTGDTLLAYYPSRTQSARWVILQNHLTDTLPSFGSTSINYAQLVYDSKRKWVLMFGGQMGCVRWDFSSNPNSPTTTQITITGDTSWIGQNGPGVLYDPLDDLYVAWVGGKTLHRVTPNPSASMACAPFVPPGAVTPTTPQLGAGGVGGVWNRFAYLPTYDVYAEISHSADSGAFVFAPVRSVATLAFTDLAAGPSTGNTDTSQSQTAGQDGAIVRIFGTNLGAATDAVTVTINGATALIYDRGACVPPRTAATLSNTIQNLSVIVAQVNHLATTGLGAISVTVNGVSSSNTLPFTVQTGAICFAAPGGTATTVATATFTNPFGNLQTAMDALAPGGILYVRSGLNLTTGLALALPAGLPAKALVAYPSAECQLGDSTHEGLPTTHSGSGQNWTYSGFTIYGTSTAHAVGSGENTLRDNTRFVGNKVLAPLGAGSLGTVGCRGTGIIIAGNEFTTCGDPASFDPQYHTLYVYGTRDTTATAPIETNRTIIWNYFHANKAARAINIYNQTQVSSPISAPISGHNVQYNYITDQVWDGILLGQGVVGDNTIANNVLVDVGKLDASSTDGGAGLHIEVTVPDSYTGTTPANVIHCYNNTFVNCGAAGKATAGTFGLRQIAAFTPDFHNNICYQANGLQYLSTGLPPVLVFPTGIAAQWSNNLWFGDGAAPTGDVSKQTTNPQLVSAVVPYDARLQSTSPCIATGAQLIFAGTDLQGVQRPASAWDIGANQFTTAAIVTAPVITSLQPASCLPGATNFTMTVFATAGQPFLSGAAVQWDGISRSTTFVSPQQVTAPILAADVAVAGPHTVTASNPGSAPSNPLTFNVTLGPATLSMVYNGTARDRVGQGTTVLAADGAFDGVFTVTLGGTGGRTITALRLDNSLGGIWDTDGATGFFILGVADSFDGAFRNNAVTMAVNFFVADGGSFVLFASDLGGILFAIGVTFTLTATFSDGSTTTGSVLIQAPVTTITVLKRLALAGGF